MKNSDTNKRKKLEKSLAKILRRDGIARRVFVVEPVTDENKINHLNNLDSEIIVENIK